MGASERSADRPPRATSASQGRAEAARHGPGAAAARQGAPRSGRAARAGGRRPRYSEKPARGTLAWARGHSGTGTHAGVPAGTARPPQAPLAHRPTLAQETTPPGRTARGNTRGIVTGLHRDGWLLGKPSNKRLRRGTGAQKRRATRPQHHSPTAAPRQGTGSRHSTGLGRQRQTAGRPVNKEQGPLALGRGAAGVGPLGHHTHRTGPAGTAAAQGRAACRDPVSGRAQQSSRIPAQRSELPHAPSAVYKLPYSTGQRTVHAVCRRALIHKVPCKTRDRRFSLERQINTTQAANNRPRQCSPGVACG